MTTTSRAMKTPGEDRRPGLFTRLLLEGIVIVGSILLAFALDTWWDERSERAEEQAILENLRAEFEAAEAQFEFYFGWHQRIEASVGQTLETARGALKAGLPRVTLPDTALALAYLSPTFDPRLGTLEGLLSSGRLRLIRDPALRHALASWNGLLREATEEETKGLRHVADQLDPVLRTRMDVSGPLGLLLPFVEGDIGADGLAGFSSVPVDSEVVGVLAVRHIHEAHGLDDLADVRDEIKRILELIEQQAPR
ncbi:MAG: hypothetical protein P8125_06440 [Gemmatimonadota bacterium]